MKILGVADSSRKILGDPGNANESLQVSEWKWKLLSVAHIKF